MQIKEYVFSDKRADSGSAEITQDQSSCSRDACFFSSMLERSPSTTATNGSPYISSALTEAIAPLKNSKNRMAKLLKSTNKELDINEFRKFPSLLSNIQVTSQLLVKCLAKTTQGIEKISNLQ